MRSVSRRVVVPRTPFRGVSAVRGGGPLGVTGVVIPVVMAALPRPASAAAPGSGPARRGAWPAASIEGAHTHAPAPLLQIALYLILRYNQSMHIISRKALRQFWEKHPDSQTALARWFKIMRQTDFRNLSELRTTFPTADKVGDWIVFNIGGNKYRLIASMHFNRGKVYIRHVLTHQEYDRGIWKL